MSDFNAVCHGCHWDTITRKRIGSGIPVCHNELTKCQQELTVSKAENARLNNVIFDLKAQIVDVERHIDHVEQKKVGLESISFNGTKKKPIPNCCEV
jgi:hypothetical protein